VGSARSNQGYLIGERMMNGTLHIGLDLQVMGDQAALGKSCQSLASALFDLDI
jgi:hypothetical protein